MTAHRRSTRQFLPLLVLQLAVLMLVAGCPEPAGDADLASYSSVDAVVEAACGQCRFDLPGEGCALAVRIDGTARFVTGTAIDDHGDAHAEDGFCNAVRRARVTGRVEGERFAVQGFELLPDAGG
jgi:hypothetical protein